MQQSTVKWFDAKKGYGFIDHPDGGEDVFVHYSQILSEKDFKTLRTGQAVEFELSDGPKGLHALDVTPTGTDEEEAAGHDGAEASASAAQRSGDGVSARPADSPEESAVAAEPAGEEEDDDDWEWDEDWTDEHGNPPDPMAGPTF